MKTKIILSAILAATVALSGSVFAAPGDGNRPDMMGSGSHAPSGDNKAALLLVKLCGPGKRNDSKGLQNFIQKELAGQLPLSGGDRKSLSKIGSKNNADKICALLKKKIQD